MQKIKTFNYLKHFRDRTGFSLQDMASVIGMQPGTLSRIESGMISPGIEVMFAYHLILKIPLTKLFKEHIKEIISNCLAYSLELKEHLLDQKSSASIHKRLSLLEIIIDRLKELQGQYE